MAKKKVVTKKAVKKTTVDKVSAEEFCIQWKKAADKGQTITELATTLGMKKEAVNGRKINYEKSLKLKFPKLTRATRTSSLDKGKLQSLLNGHPL